MHKCLLLVRTSQQDKALPVLTGLPGSVTDWLLDCWEGVISDGSPRSLSCQGASRV